MESEPLIEFPIRTAEGLWFKPTSKQRSTGNEYVVYMIPGNPCLMTFYEPFLLTLFNLLNDGSKDFSAHVGGYTLPGFESGTVPQINGEPLPASLRAEVKNTEKMIKLGFQEHIHSKADNKNQRAVKVILIGHSVGAYIALEILRRRAQGQNNLSEVEIAGGVLVCPTVTDIAQSTRGAIVNQLSRIPSFPTIVGIFARLITFLLPLWCIHWLIAFFGRMPPHVAQATAEFLKSPTGVTQALFMARDEMHEIKEDRWDEAIWGSSDALASSSVSLKLYFAENDVWVSNRSRDALMKSRGRSVSNTSPSESWKPEMIIDDNKIPHAFIIDHSELVAEKVKSLVEDIIATQRR